MSGPEQDLLGRCRDAVKRALEKGADQAEVFAQRSSEVRVQLESDDLSIARSDEDEGFGIRIRLWGVTGFASTNDGTRESLDEAIEAAIALARVSPADDKDDLPEPDGSVPGAVEGLWDPAIPDTKVDSVARHVGELAERVHQLDSRLRLDSGWIGLETGWTALASSTGVEVSERTTGAQALLMGMAVDGERVGSFDHEVIDVCSLEALERELQDLPGRFAERVLSCLEARPGESFRGTLVLAPEAVAGFLLPLPLICNGELRAFLYNTREARAAGKSSSTGHARGGARSVPGIGPSNLIVATGDFSPAALLEEIERGLLLRRFSGNSDPVSGDFSGVAKSSFLLRRGEPPQPVQETLLSGNLFELLESLSGVGRDRSWIDGRVQTPSLRFEGVSVTAG